MKTHILITGASRGIGLEFVRQYRADGVKVTVYRQVNTDGQWVDAEADPETAIQLENKILERARLLRTSQIG